MEYWRHNHSTLCRIFLLTAIIMLIAIGPGQIVMGATGSASPIIAKCKSDLARRLKLKAQDIKLIDSRPTTWSDTALGMPEIGRMYAQVITPGSRVTLEARSTRYLYTASAKAFRYGGPVSIWSYSMLYTVPVKNEPNLNGDLYQCSLLGTNSVRLISGVTEFYPQEKGAVIATRRLSRSGHELLYLSADRAAKPRTLYSAFDFGGAAVNGAHDKWAAFSRPMVGANWTVVVAPIGGDKTKVQTLPLPDGVRPGQIAWTGETLMILVKSGEETACYETSPSTGTPAWKAVADYTFPDLRDYMLNKSETLEITQVTANGKPAVEVARVWFTGDRNVKARIDGVTLRGYDFRGGRYAFVWGEKNLAPVFYTVDISTGEVIPAPSGVGENARPFADPPRITPLASKKP